MTRGGYPSGVTQLLRLMRVYGLDDPRVLEVRAANPAAARVADYIRRDVAERPPPPLSPDQRERLILILAPARDAVAASRASRCRAAGR